MQKFTKAVAGETQQKEAQTVWQGRALAVKSMDGWEFVSEPDHVVCLPLIVTHGQVLLRAEVVPCYGTRFPGVQRFMTALSGTMEEGETPSQAMRREIEEEAGIRLRDHYALEPVCSLMANKGSNSRYHLFLPEFGQHDFSVVRATGDGSEAEKQSACVYVPVTKLSRLKPVDLITAHLLQLFREQHGL